MGSTKEIGIVDNKLELAITLNSKHLYYTNQTVYRNKSSI